MSSVMLILLGTLVVWMAVTNQSADIFNVITKGPTTGGYNDIPIGRFLIGAAIVSTPLFVMKEDDWQKTYILLIVLGFLTFNMTGLSRFSNYITTAVKK